MADEAAFGQQRKRVVEHDFLVGDLVGDVLPLGVLAHKRDGDQRQTSSFNVLASMLRMTP